jgi:hypothetical protein
MDDADHRSGGGWRDIAAALWSGYPDGAESALLDPTDSFPAGALLGRFRLDPLDPTRTGGGPVDVLAVDAGDEYTQIRCQLLDRALHAAVLSDGMVDELLDSIDKMWFGPWDDPWQLIGLVPAGEAAGWPIPPYDGADAGAGAHLEVCLLQQLVPVGLGHPGEVLYGLIAPPPVFGLVLVNEGYERDDAGRRIGEIRMFILALADGRWGFRCVRRDDSPYSPSADSTVGGTPVGESEHKRDESTRTIRWGYEALAGTLPETLARVLQVSVDTDVDPYETVLRILASSAANLAEAGWGVADVARLDPAAVACFGIQLLEHVERGGDEAAAIATVASFTELLGERAAGGDGDWLDDAMLAKVQPHHALQTAAGAYRALEHIGDTEAAWLGPELMAGRAAELAGAVSASLATVARHDPTLAERLARVVEHRRARWDVSSDDDVGAAVRMAVARGRGRNDRCPCGSGRKVKRCCM